MAKKVEMTKIAKIFKKGGETVNWKRSGHEASLEPIAGLSIGVHSRLPVFGNIR